YSPGHTHPKSAFIYATVLEGAIRSQVNDGSVMTYQTGQSFSELPGDRHTVSTNASNTKPAKASRGVRGGHERDGIDDPIRELGLMPFMRRHLQPRYVSFWHKADITTMLSNVRFWG